MLTFAEFLSKRRAALGMSMTELAERLDVTPQYVSLLEAGKCNPSRKLQLRCAEFFNETPEYVRFLAQPIPVEQKRALLQTPDALPFLSGRDESLIGSANRQPDSEDGFLQRLFAPVETGVPSESAPFYDRLISQILDENEHSQKARAWAQYYRAALVSQTQGREAALPELENLVASMDGSAHYPDALRLRAAFRMAESLAEDGEWARTGAAFAEAAKYASLADDGELGVETHRRAAEAYRQAGDPERVIDIYGQAANVSDVPAPVKAGFYMDAARLLFHLVDNARAMPFVEDAVKIWRLRSLDISDKTAQLVASQILGLHILVELERPDEARQWLGRIRSSLARVTVREMSPALRQRFVAESDLESAALMVQQGRWNHAWKNLAEIERLAPEIAPTFDTEDDATLFIQRLRLLQGFVARGREDANAAKRFARRILDEPPLNDAAREIGRHTMLRASATRLLDQDAATVALTSLIERIHPDNQDSDALRNLCDAPSIRNLRAEVAQAAS